MRDRVLEYLDAPTDAGRSELADLYATYRQRLRSRSTPTTSSRSSRSDVAATTTTTTPSTRRPASGPRSGGATRSWRASAPTRRGGPSPPSRCSTTTPARRPRRRSCNARSSTAAGEVWPERADTIEQAVANSLARWHRIDPGYVADQLAVDAAAAEAQLAEVAFQTPAGEWDLAAHYLAGDVVGKLDEALAAATADRPLRPQRRRPARRATDAADRGGDHPRVRRDVARARRHRRVHRRPRRRRRHRQVPPADRDLVLRRLGTCRAGPVPHRPLHDGRTGHAGLQRQAGHRARQAAGRRPRDHRRRPRSHRRRAAVPGQPHRGVAGVVLGRPRPGHPAGRPLQPAVQPVPGRAVGRLPPHPARPRRRLHPTTAPEGRRVADPRLRRPRCADGPRGRGRQDRGDDHRRPGDPPHRPDRRHRPVRRARQHGRTVRPRLPAAVSGGPGADPARRDADATRCASSPPGWPPATSTPRSAPTTSSRRSRCPPTSSARCSSGGSPTSTRSTRPTPCPARRPDGGPASWRRNRPASPS